MSDIEKLLHAADMYISRGIYGDLKYNDVDMGDVNHTFAAAFVEMRNELKRMEWQPIETAPKDGLFECGGMCYETMLVFSAYIAGDNDTHYDDGELVIEGKSGMYTKWGPTHWRHMAPLPKPKPAT